MMISKHLPTSSWFTTHWSNRYLLLVWFVDAVSKLAIINSVELGTGHLFMRSGWGIGILWVEHGAPSYSGWGFALFALVIWVVMAVILERDKRPLPEGLKRGMSMTIAGTIANAVDAGFDHSVVDWIGVVTPWVSHAFNIADLAMLFGGIEMLTGFICLEAKSVGDKLNQHRKQKEARRKQEGSETN